MILVLQDRNRTMKLKSLNGSPASNKADMPSTGSSLAFSLADKSFYETPYDNIKNS
jgi:hypothetical protein